MTTFRLVLLLSIVTLSACGFQLRGLVSNLPFETIHVTAPPGNPIGIDVERAIRAGTVTKVVDSPENAQAILQIISAINEKKILSLSVGGRVREFQLGYRVAVRLVDPQGAEIAPIDEISLTRVLPFLDAQLLAKQAEEEMLYKDMQIDAVQQIIRRLAAIKTPPKNN